MAESANELLIILDATNERLKRALKDSDKAVDHTAKQIDRSLDAANDSFHGFESAVAGAASRIGVALAGIGVAAAAAGVGVSKAFSTLEDLQDLKRTAEGLGITTTKLQELNYTFAQFGIDAGQVPEVFSQISAQAREALTGSDSMVRAFRDLGISVDDLRGKSPAQVLKLLAEGAQNTGNDVMRLGALSTLLGDDLAKLLSPMLVQGAAALNKFAGKAHKAGAVLSDELIGASGPAAQKIKDLKLQFSAEFTQAVAENAEAFGKLADALADVVRFGGKAVDFLSGPDTTVNAQPHGPRVRLEELKEQRRILEEGYAATQKALQGDAEAIQTQMRLFIEKVRPINAEIRKLEAQLGSDTTTLAPMTVTATRLPPQGSAPHEFRPMDGFLGAVDESIGDKMLSNTKELTDQFTLLEQVGQRATRGIASGFADAIVEGKSLGDVFKSLAEDITKMILKQLIFNAIKQGLSGTSFGAAMGFADGGAFNQNGLIPFAKGGIVTRPTIFPFANGTGLTGEAGPEAILPLERGPGGKLGVISSGSGSNVIVNVTNTSGQAKASASSRRGPDGQQMIDIMVEDSFNRLLGSGQLDQSLAANMGVRRPGRF